MQSATIPKLTADHTKSEVLDDPFETGSGVTKVCLSCHSEAGHPLYEPRTQASRMVPYADELIVQKPDGMLTHLPPDLEKVAAHVGRPTRESCGNCHFYGGGGDDVKHGDLSSALVDPSPHVDVHMSPDGADMVCVDCYAGDGHAWPGSRYHGTIRDTSHQRPGMRNTDILARDSCHTSTPHKALSLKGDKLNDHTDRVACQTCHIPECVKGGVATKISWDWSTGGKLKDGLPYKEVDEHGRDIYLIIKGDFRCAENVVPDYELWDDVVEYMLLGDKIDSSDMVSINRLGGGADQPGSGSGSAMCPRLQFRGRARRRPSHDRSASIRNRPA